MPASQSSSSPAGSRSRTKSAERPSSAKEQVAGVAEGLAGLVEQLVNTILRPFDIVMLSRDRIQQTLDEAAERGRMTRGDANDLVVELIRRGRQQTDELLAELERMVGRGWAQFDSARKRARQSEPVDHVMRAADRARQSVGAGSSFPISGYDEMTASQVNKRLSGLSRPQLRAVREYESRHANRKTVLEALDRAMR